MTDQAPSTLAVILHADVADSTELVRRDESLAHERIQDAFQRLSRHIETYGGRAHELRGDALVAEFHRVSDAVCAALAFQEDNAGVNEGLADAIRPAVRIGISLGEIVVADNTMTGAGIVLAQRIEQLAEAGGVCIQSAAHDAMPERFRFRYESLGERELKGFPEPVRVFAVTTEPGYALPPPQPLPPDIGGARKTGRRGAVALWAVAFGAVLTTAALSWWYAGQREAQGPGAETAPTKGVANGGAPPPATTGRTAPVGERGDDPQKPSIAVLPFLNMSGDGEQDYFSDGISEDLITDLSKISALTVIARASSFVYKGDTPDLREVGRDLGVRYVLEGSVRRAGSQVRINAQLIDASTGSHLWAERYDGSYDDVFALQDKVTARIVASLAVKLTANEQDRIARKETQNTEAYDAFLKGWERYQRQRPESFAQAIAHFERAIQLDPSYSRAYAALSATYWQIWKRYWHREFGMESPHDPRFKAEEYLVEAMRQTTPLALQVSTAMLSQQGRHDEAIADGERAIAFDPNDADGYVVLAGALNLAGQHPRALEFVERAIRLNPSFPPNYLYELGLTQFCMDKFEDAAVSLEKATALNPDDRWSLRLLLATYGQLGRVAEATRLLRAAETNWGGLDPLSVRSVLFWYAFGDPVDRERLADGLRKAGVPE